jgi:hypothetical protein
MKKLLFVSSIIGLVALVGASVAEAQTASNMPVVKTYSSNGQTGISIVVPNGYNGSVSTTYDGKTFHTTYASSSPMTSAQFEAIQNNIQAQINAMNTYIEEQQKLLQQMWSNLGWSY